MDGILAVILGGGAGSRLHPLTLHRSKPAVPLAGKYRLIDIPISNCINSAISRIFILTQFNSASLNRHIATTYHFDRFRRGFVSVLAAEQTPSNSSWFQGTADAVRRSMPHLNVYNHQQVLILAGDHLYRMDYRDMLDHHVACGADISVATIPVTAGEASGFGILQTGEGGVITEFHEKPRPDQLHGLESPVSDNMREQGRVYLASMGIYIFQPDVLRAALDGHPDDTDFGRQIIPRSIHERRVVSYLFSGYWRDIGTISSYYDAHMALTRSIPPFDMYDPVAPIYSNARMLPPAKVQDAELIDSIVGEASILVRCRIERSVIGIRSFVGSDTVITNSVMTGSDYFPWQDPMHRPTVEGPLRPGIDENTVIDRAIIDRNVSIGKRCVIRNREGTLEGQGPGFFIRDGLIVIPKNTRIDDDTVI